MNVIPEKSHLDVSIDDSMIGGQPQAADRLKMNHRANVVWTEAKFVKRHVQNQRNPYPSDHRKHVREHEHLIYNVALKF